MDVLRTDARYEVFCSRASFQFDLFVGNNSESDLIVATSDRTSLA